MLISRPISTPLAVGRLNVRTMLDSYANGPMKT